MIILERRKAEKKMRKSRDHHGLSTFRSFKHFLKGSDKSNMFGVAKLGRDSAVVGQSGRLQREACPVPVKRQSSRSSSDCQPREIPAGSCAPSSSCAQKLAVEKSGEALFHTADRPRVWDADDDRSARLAHPNRLRGPLGTAGHRWNSAGIGQHARVR